MTTDPILILGATGRVGSVVTSLLTQAGHDVRLLTRNPFKVNVGTRGQAKQCDVRSPAEVQAASVGSTVAFLCTPDAPDQDVWELSISRALQDAGVTKIVKLSAQSAGLTPPRSFGTFHLNVEKAIAHDHPRSVMLRPMFFQESLLLFADDIRKGTVVLPTKGGATAMVSVDDVGAVAAAALTSNTYDGSILTLTGPRAITFREALDEVATELGKAVKLRSIPRPLAKIVMPRVTKMPSWLTSNIIDLLAAIDEGAQSTPTGDVERVLGRAPRLLVDTLRQHRAAFT
jgi:uncharacterized protein YbjT (DUF2867 family)